MYVLNQVFKFLEEYQNYVYGFQKISKRKSQHIEDVYQFGVSKFQNLVYISSYIPYIFNFFWMPKGLIKLKIVVWAWASSVQYSPWRLQYWSYNSVRGCCTGYTATVCIDSEEKGKNILGLVTFIYKLLFSRCSSATKN